MEVSPSRATLAAGGTQRFVATVKGSSITAVAWSVESPSAGMISSDGEYTAPATGGTFTVLARSVVDATAVATATVEVTAGELTVAPPSASLRPGQTQAFTASEAVSWGVPEAGGGTITAAGLYTAPPASGVFHVIARSQGDANRTKTVTVTVDSGSGVRVMLTPASASLGLSATQQFTATVTGSADARVAWSVEPANGGGAITASGLYTAPAVAGSYQVVASSLADPSQTAKAQVDVTASPQVISVAVSPKQAQVISGGTQAFTATVAGAANGQVTWSVEPASGGSITTAGVFTAGSAAGSVVVRATSVADAARSGTAQVTVVAASLPVSGTVSYGGAKTGRIYLALVGGSGFPVAGTSLPAPGPFTIRGAPPGTYKLTAFLDSTGQAHPLPLVDPSGELPGVTAGSSGNSVQLFTPPAISLPAPTSLGVWPGDSAALLSWSALNDDQGRCRAEAYRVYWSATPGPGPGNNLGVLTVKAGVASTQARVRGLTNGASYYFGVAGVNAGVIGPVRASGPVLINAPTGGGAISGQLAFTGSPPAGHSLFVFAAPAGGGPIAPFATLTPVGSGASYTLTGVPAGTSKLYLHADHNGNGLPESTEPYFLLAEPVVTAGATTQVPTRTIDFSPYASLLRTGYVVNGANAFHLRELILEQRMKIIVKATVDGPGLGGPVDLPLDPAGVGTYDDLRAAVPVVGQTFSLTLELQDGTVLQPQLSITGLFTQAPALAAPAAGQTQVSRVPTFSWTPPPGASDARVELYETSGGGSTHVWGGDAPAAGPLTAGVTLAANAPHRWYLYTFDANGNFARGQADFTTGP